MPLWRHRVVDAATLRLHLAQAARSRNRSATRRRLNRIVADAQRVPDARRAMADGVRGEALIALGDLEHGAGKRAKALLAYRGAERLIPLPARILHRLADDAARRGDLTEFGIRDLLGRFRDYQPPAEPDPVVEYVRGLCIPPKSDFEFAAMLSTRIIGVAPSIAWAHFARGRARIVLGGTAEAVADLVRAEELDRAYAATPFLLGRAYRTLREPAAARDAFRRAHALAPDRLDILLELSEVDLDEFGEYRDEAIRALTEACGSPDATAELWHRLATALRDRDPPAARTALEAAAGMEPGNALVRIELAELADRTGHTPAAIASLSDALAIDPRSPAALGLARILNREQRFGEVDELLAGRISDRETAYERAVALVGLARDAEAAALLAPIQRRNVAERQLRGRALARSGALDEAARELADARSGPGLDLALGCVEARRENWAGALRAFIRAGADPSPPADLHLFRGVTRHRLGDLDGAAQDLDRARRAAPDDARVWCAIGAVALDRRDIAAAKAALTRAVAASPGSADAHAGMGLIAEHEKNSAAAIRHYRLATEADPGWPGGRQRIAAIHLGAGEATVAGEALGPRLSTDPDADVLRALVLAETGEEQQAHELWEEIRRRAGDTDGSLTANLVLSADRLACDALARGDAASARRWWEKGLRLAPQDPGFPAAIAEACLRTARRRLSSSANRAARADAARHLDRAASLAPDDPRPRYLLALLALHDGRADAALALLATVAEHDDPGVAYHLALASAAAGRPVDEVERHLARAHPPEAVHVLRGTVAALDGAWADAADEFRKALDAAPGGACPADVLVAITRCAVEGSAIPDTVALLHEHGLAHPGCLTAGRLLGLLAAEQGDLDAALPLLSGDPLARVHLLVAAKLTGRGNRVDAEREIVAAAVAHPESPEVTRLRRRIPSWAALVHEHSGRLAEAIELREESARRKPMDLVRVHRVAVLARRMLEDGETSSDIARLAIATWAAVLASPEFWVMLGERTQRPVGDDEGPARHRFSAEFGALLRTVAADPVRLDVEWGLERRCATEVARFMRAVPVAGWSQGFGCGPRYLERLAATADGARLVSRLRAAGQVSDLEGQLSVLLSPLGTARHLIDDRRLEDAIAELNQHSGPGAEKLRGEAWLRWAAWRAENDMWAEAIDGFVRAAGCGADVRAERWKLQQATRHRIQQLHNVQKDYAAAAATMESVRELLPDDAWLRENLAATYAELSRQRTRLKDGPGGLAAIRRALALAPENPTIRGLAWIMLENRVAELLRAGSDSEIDSTLPVLEETLHGADDAGSATTWRAVAGLYRHRGRHDMAIEVLTDAHERHRSDVPLHDALVEALRTQGVRLALALDHDRAIGYLGRAHRLVDDEAGREVLAQALYGRALARAHTDPPGARRDAAEAARLDPDNPLYRRPL